MLRSPTPLCALRAGAKLARLQASGRIAAIPQGSRPPRPAAPRGPLRVCRPRASKCARPYCRATLHAPFGLAVISVIQIARLLRPPLSHDPARSIWACRDFGLSKSAPPAPRPLAGGRAQTQNLASSSILEASCLGASSGALAATRASLGIRAESNRALQTAPPRQPQQGSQGGGGPGGLRLHPDLPKT